MKALPLYPLKVLLIGINLDYTLDLKRKLTHISFIMEKEFSFGLMYKYESENLISFSSFFDVHVFHVFFSFHKEEGCQRPRSRS